MPKPFIYRKKKSSADKFNYEPIIHDKPPKIPQAPTLTQNEQTKISFANAIKETLSSCTITYLYPIIKEYSGKLIYNHITDFADSILKDNPYNNSHTSIDISTLSEDETNDYINHLKQFHCVEQHDLNSLWIPNGVAWFHKGLKCSAKCDIAIISDNNIIEIWLITDILDTLPDRVNSIISAGYDIPIYHARPADIMRFLNLSPSELYTTVKNNAKLLYYSASTTIIDTNNFITSNHTKESDIHLNAKIILAQNIKNTGNIPYIEYPIISDYGIMPLNNMVTEFAPKILKLKPYNGSFIPPDVNKLSDDDYNKYIAHIKTYNANQYNLNDHWVPNLFLQKLYLNKLIAIADIAINDGETISELWEIFYKHPVTQEKINKLKANGYEYIPIYEIDAEWIISNKDADNLYELAKLHATRWN
jgi:hypothetical protein